MRRWIEIPSGSYGPDSTGVNEALAAGYRHLVLTRHIDVYEPVDLDAVSGSDFCFEAGRYWSSLEWRRRFSGGPLLKADKEVRITIRGIAFLANELVHPNSGTLVRLKKVTHSLFKGCVCLGGGHDPGQATQTGGHGFHLGDASARAT